MKTLNSKLKNRKQIIGLFTALLFISGFVFTASSCCKNDIPEPEPEKVVIMFGVDSGEGTLEATADGTKIYSRSEIEKGKTVVFKANHSKSWEIQYWKVNGIIIRSVEPTQTFGNLSEHMDIRVAFKKWVSSPI
ncbi:MAG: hypothetical protein ACOYEG_08035 [Petrimonas sp.]|jgi:hypothetical protein|nr:MAG: hypothetical protein BWZ00_00449 [Bacteroidetes bacterium ADurb.BinA174]